MTRGTVGLWVLVVLAVVPAPCRAAVGTPVRLVRDVPYVAEADPAQRLDLRVPHLPGPLPVVVLVHGGGWTGGDKAGADKPNSGADITPWFDPLAQAGFLVVSINYRLAPEHPWPAALLDTRSALRWVHGHIAAHGGDPARVAIMGHSAGGQLALFAALPTERGPAPVRAVVGCAAVSDLVADTERRGGPSSSLRALLGIGAEPGPDEWTKLAEASPITRVTAEFPPTLLLHGDVDKTVPPAQSLTLQTRLHAVGVPCDLHMLPGAGHRLTEWTAHDPTWGRVMTDWLNANLAERSPGAANDAHDSL